MSTYYEVQHYVPKISLRESGWEWRSIDDFQHVCSQNAEAMLKHYKQKYPNRQIKLAKVKVQKKVARY